MSFPEKRRHARKDIFTAALVALGDEGFLSEVWDVSSGGARLGRPQRWKATGEAAVRIYFMLDQETVIALGARVVRTSEEHLGVEFFPGQDERVQALLYEARFMDPAGR